MNGKIGGKDVKDGKAGGMDVKDGKVGGMDVRCKGRRTEIQYE
jgi:hypothetical protein